MTSKSKSLPFPSPLRYTNLVVAAGDDVDELVHDDGGHAAPVESQDVQVVVAQ